MLARDRLSHYPEFQEDFDLEASRDYQQPDCFYDDDQQPIYQDGKRSPKRRLLPSTPQAPGRPTFTFECLRRQSSQEDLPLSPSCRQRTALPLHLMQQQVMAVAGLDSSRIQHLSPTRSLRSWATPPTSPIGRDRSTSYTPLIQVDWRGRDSVSSTPGAVRRSSWYSDAPEAPLRHAYSPSLLQIPPEYQLETQTRGSANSLVEAVLISEGLGKYAKDPKFVAATKHEIADACELTIDEMESAASTLLNGSLGIRAGSEVTESLAAARGRGLHDYSDEEADSGGKGDEDLTDEMICITTL